MRSFLAPVLAAASLLTLSAAARAGFIADALGSAGPGNFAVLGLGGTTVSVSDLSLTGPGTTTGNVGVASSGKLSLSSSSPPAIIGNVYVGNTATLNGNTATQVQGKVFYNQDAFLGTGSSTNPATATGAVRDAITAANTFSALANTFTVAGGSITGSKTLDLSGSGQTVNVTHITNLQLNNGDNLILKGLAGQQVVIDVSGTFKLNADLTGGKILLQGGLSAADVVFNITGTGADVATSGGSSGGLPNAQINGIVLTLQRKIAFAPGLVNGEIIGGGASISLVSGSQVNGPLPPPPAVVPEPSTIALALTGLASLGLAGVRRSRRRATA
jgi:hypothetical protein